MKRALVCLVVAMLAAAVLPHPAAFAGSVYWAASGKIQKAALDGSKVRDFAAAFASEDVTVNSSDGTVWWTDDLPLGSPLPGGVIRTANPNGLGAANVLSGLNPPAGLAVQPPAGNIGAGKVYWTDPVARQILRADLDGSRMETLVTDLSGVADLALDMAAGKMYWTQPAVAFTSQGGGPGGIIPGAVRRANLDGSNVEDIVKDLYGPARGIAVDPVAGKLYWSYVDPNIDSLFAGMIKQSNLDGSGVQSVVSGLLSPYDVALDAIGKNLYWTDMEPVRRIDNGIIQRSTLEGDKVETLVAMLIDPRGLAVDPASRFDFEPGDADQDGDVDILDVSVMQTKYGLAKGATWADGDFDGNGTVDIFDVALMQPNYGHGVANPTAPVPEPSTLALALCGLAVVWCVRGLAPSPRLTPRDYSSRTRA
ncbi:MAG: hypothetical protein ACYC35_09115 [Pirellulales bacterium]